jgi:hypothetical protein
MTTAILEQMASEGGLPTGVFAEDAVVVEDKPFFREKDFVTKEVNALVEEDLEPKVILAKVVYLEFIVSICVLD